MAKILGVGIATIDIINYVESFPTEDSEIRAIKQEIKRGGNVTNTLAILSQLGHQCYWSGTLANETDAQRITSDLSHYRINTDYVDTSTTGKVPTSYILLNQSNGSRSIVHYRDLPELSFNSFKSIPLSEFDWIHFEARNIDQTLLMLEYLKHYHPGICCSVEFEKKRENIEKLYQYADILIFSKAYCKEYSGNSPELFIASLNKRYLNKTIIQAWGEDGCYGSQNNNKIIHSPSVMPAKIVDTLGAGDTFNGGIIDSMIRQYPFEQSLNNANALASFKISVSGFDISTFNN